MSEESYLRRELRRRMLLGGFSMRGLSLAAKVNETAVKAILSGKSRHPRHDTLESLAGALGCTVNDLLTPTAAPSALDRLPPDKRGRAIDVLTELLDEADQRRTQKRGR